MRRFTTLLLAACLACGAAATPASAAGTVAVDDAGACIALQHTGTTGTADPPLVAPRLSPSRSKDPAASATIDESTKVSPVQVDVHRALRPGDAFTCVVTIRNRHSKAMTFTLEPVGIRGARDGGIAFIGFEDAAIATTAARWIDPAQGRITLAPRGVAKVPVTVTVPSKPPVGAAYAFLMVVPSTAAAAAPGSSAGLGIQGRVAVAFLLRVGGSGRPRLALRDQHVAHLRWDRASWTYGARLDNSGTLHARPRGRVRIRSLFGGTVATLGISGRTLLPGGSEPVAATWRALPWIGLYRYDVRITSSGHGAAASTVQASGWFVALPAWWVLAIALLVVVGLVGGAVVRRRHEHDWRTYLDDDDDDFRPRRSVHGR